MEEARQFPYRLKSVRVSLPKRMTNIPKTKILLINPSQLSSYENTKMISPYPPLGLLYIARILEEKNYEIKLIDTDADNITKNDFNEILEEFNPDFVGLTATTPTINNAFNIAKSIKRLNKDIVIFIGGVHPTIVPEECISHDYIDFVIQGEGEETIAELLDTLTYSDSNKEQNKNLAEVKGIWYKEKGKPVFTGARPLIKDLDSIPFIPKYLFDVNKYIPPDVLKKPVGFIITSRGCYARCTYCCQNKIFGRIYRTRSTKNILEEVEEWVKKYHVKEIHIVDDAFSFDKNRVIEIAEEFSKRKLPVSFALPNGIRADCASDEVLLALKKLGVRSLGFGVESGNEQILRNIKKGLNLTTLRDTFKRVRKMGFVIWAFFMIGLPGENKKIVQETIDFAKELNPDFAKFLILKPYPGTEIFEELNSQGLIFDHDYSKYGAYSNPVHNLPDLSAEEMYKLQKKAYMEFYLRPTKILSHILRIRSLTQLMINIKFSKYIFKLIIK